MIDMNQAVQSILQRVDALAEKIGTTAQQIYSVYVAQARVEAIRDGFIGALVLIAGIWFFVNARHFWKRGREENYHNENTVVFAILFSVLTIVMSIVFLIYAYSAIGEGLNPNYWAFQHLTQDLHNLM